MSKMPKKLKTFDIFDIFDMFDMFDTYVYTVVGVTRGGFTKQKRQNRQNGIAASFGIMLESISDIAEYI